MAKNGRPMDVLGSRKYPKEDYEMEEKSTSCQLFYSF